MKLKNSNLLSFVTLIATLVAFSMFASSCKCTRIAISEDLNEYISALPPVTDGNSQLNEGVDLYVDYSTCVSCAMEQKYYSTYFNAVLPAILNSNPDYYAIMGSNIEMLTSNNSERVFQLLNTVQNTNYADIKKAVDMIVNANKEAILITDGEYFLNDDKPLQYLNSPYLTKSFEKWIKDGHEIFFYSEPYRELYRGNEYPKNRYYIIFTDSSINNNLNDRFVATAAIPDGVTTLHLNNGTPKVDGSFMFNPSLSVINEKSFTQFGIKWDDVKKYLSTGDLSQDYVFRGITVSNNNNDAFKVEGVKLNVYSLYGDYEKFCTDSNKVANMTAKPLKQSPFEVDDATFASKGEVIVKLSSSFDGYYGLEAEPGVPNIFRIDIVTDTVVDDFSNNDVISGAFKWNSIQQNGENTSMLVSISQIMLNKKAYSGRILKTIYLSTPSAGKGPEQVGCMKF